MSSKQSPWANTGAASSATPSTTALPSGAAVTAVTNAVAAINSVESLTNQDKIQLMQQWADEKSVQSSLDTQAALSLGASSGVQTTYDAAVLAIDTYLGTTLGYSTWKTTWPDGVTVNLTGIMTTLRGLWNTVASTRALLQQALDAVALQALTRASTNAPAMGLLSARPTLPNVAFPAGTFYYATDSTAGDGLAGTLYQNVAGTWTVIGGSVLQAGRIVAANITAGSIGAAALAASIVLTSTLLMTWTAGTGSAAPIGIKLAGTQFTSYFLDGTNALVNAEIGGAVNWLGYNMGSLAIAKLAGSGFQEWTAAGTYSWKCPANITAITLSLTSGGGSGSSLTGTGCGGGAGTSVKVRIPVTPGTTYQVIVGAGGASVTGSNGNNGGTSSFGPSGSPVVSITGGIGGTTVGGNGGALSTTLGYGSLAGGLGGTSGAGAATHAIPGFEFLAAMPGAGGGLYGYAGGATDFYTGGISGGAAAGGGGSSAYGSGGSASAAGNASPGGGHGSGGGGTGTATKSSGAGSDGYARIDF